MTLEDGKLFLTMAEETLVLLQTGRFYRHSNFVCAFKYCYMEIFEILSLIRKRYLVKVGSIGYGKERVFDGVAYAFGSDHWGCS